MLSSTSRPPTSPIKPAGTTLHGCNGFMINYFYHVEHLSRLQCHFMISIAATFENLCSRLNKINVVAHISSQTPGFCSHLSLCSSSEPFQPILRSWHPCTFTAIMWNQRNANIVLKICAHGASSKEGPQKLHTKRG